MSQYQQLKDFVKDIMKEYPELDNWDGFELQELAEKHKILIPETVNKPCGEGCNCSEYSSDLDFSKGVQCFRLADWLFTPETYTRPNLSTKEKYDAEKSAKTLLQKYGFGNVVKIISSLCIENVRLVKEINEHRAARGIEPLPTFEV